MNRRFWLGLSVVPFVLIGVAFWARKATWERMEETYRHELATRAFRYSGQPGVEIIKSRRYEGVEKTNRLGVWEHQDLQTAISQMHLVRQSPADSRVRDGEYLQFVGPPYVFIVSLDHDWGVFLQAGSRSSDELKVVALSPATCRALKRRVGEKYGGKLRALRFLSF